MHTATTLRETEEFLVHAITGPETPAATMARYVTPGARMSATERLGVYRGGYVSRLVECLRDDYPVLAQALGDPGFFELARDYVEKHPSTSPNLNFYGAKFASFCRTSHALSTDDAREFYAELAQLEWALVEVLHEPTCSLPDITALLSLPPEAWATARFIKADALRVLHFDYPVDAYFQPCFAGDDPPPIPTPSASAVAVYRSDKTLWRMSLTPAMLVVLTPLLGGKTIGEALQTIEEEVTDEAWLTEIGQSLGMWFREWTSAGFFARIELATHT